MSDMLDSGTERYFNEKFKNVDGKLDNLISAMDKNEIQIAEVKEEVIILKSFKDDHQKHHESKENKRKWNIEMWVIVLVFVFDKIGSWIQSINPPSP